MKRTALILVAIPAFASADGLLGTKVDTATQVAAGNPLLSLIQMAIAIAIVVALLKVVVPKFAARLGGKLNATLNSSIQIEESANFPGGSLYVVSARNKTLLLGVSGTNIQCLSELETKPKADPGKTFSEMVQESDAASQQHLRLAQVVPEASLATTVEDIEGAELASSKAHKFKRNESRDSYADALARLEQLMH